MSIWDDIFNDIWNDIWYDDEVAALLSPLGRKPVGVNQRPYSGTDYPFVDPSTDIDQLIADLHLGFRDDENQFVEPFSVFYLYGFGDGASSAPAGAPTPANEYDIVIRDSLGQTVFDSTTAAVYHKREWSSRLRLHEWQTESAVCKLLQHTKWAKEADITEYLQHISPANGLLQSRATVRWTPYVRGLIIDSTLLTGDLVELEAGYNTVLDVEDLENADGHVYGHRVTINAKPGAGAGRYPACSEPEVLLRTLNGVGPDAQGNLRLDFSDCYRFVIPLQLTNETAPFQYRATPAAIQVVNDCQPCCRCRDYVYVYRALTRVWERVKDIGNRSERARDQQALNVERWTKQKNCRDARALKLAAIPACPCVINIGAAYTNTTEDCMYDIEIRFEMSIGGANGSPYGVVESGSLACGKTTLGAEDQPYVLAGSWPKFKGTMDVLQPGETMLIKFQMTFEGCANGDNLRIQAEARDRNQNDPPRSVVIKRYPLIPAPEGGSCLCS